MGRGENSVFAVFTTTPFPFIFLTTPQSIFRPNSRHFSGWSGGTSLSTTSQSKYTPYYGREQKELHMLCLFLCQTIFSLGNRTLVFPSSHAAFMSTLSYGIWPVKLFSFIYFGISRKLKINRLHILPRMVIGHLPTYYQSREGILKLFCYRLITLLRGIIFCQTESCVPCWIP